MEPTDVVVSSSIVLVVKYIPSLFDLFMPFNTVVAERTSPIDEGF
jgi:hypothetical protein